MNFVRFENNLDYSSSENEAFIIKGFYWPNTKRREVWFVTGYVVFDGPSIARLPKISITYIIEMHESSYQIGIIKL